jgi:hypothetical protein
MSASYYSRYGGYICAESKVGELSYQIEEALEQIEYLKKLCGDDTYPMTSGDLEEVERLLKGEK